jgi:hypothetical protein
MVWVVGTTVLLGQGNDRGRLRSVGPPRCVKMHEPAYPSPQVPASGPREWFSGFSQPRLVPVPCFVPPRELGLARSPTRHANPVLRGLVVEPILPHPVLRVIDHSSARVGVIHGNTTKVPTLLRCRKFPKREQPGTRLGDLHGCVGVSQLLRRRVLLSIECGW